MIGNRRGDETPVIIVDLTLHQIFVKELLVTYLTKFSNLKAGALGTHASCVQGCEDDQLR
jgi:hypothetical protein